MSALSEFGAVPVRKKEESALAEFGAVPVTKAGPAPSALAEFGAVPASPPSTSAAASEPDVSGTEIPPEAIEAIAKKHGVRSDTLHMLAPIMGTSVRGANPVGQTLLRAEGLVSEGLMGLPVWIAKQFEDENGRKAVDELRELTDKYKSTPGKLAEFAAGMAFPVGRLKGIEKAGKLAKVAYAAGEGAAIGATYSLAHASDEHAVEAALDGAKVGALFGGFLGTIGAVATRGAPPPTARSESILPQFQKAKAEIEANPSFQTAATHTFEMIASKQARPPTIPNEMIVANRGMPMSVVTLRKFKGDVDAAVEYQLQQEIQSTAREFVGFVKGTKTPKTDRGLQTGLGEISYQGEPFLQRQWERFTAIKATERAVQQDVRLKLPTNRNFVDRALQFISDGRLGTARSIDERHPGIGLEPLMDSGSVKLKTYVNTLADILTNDEAQAVMERTRKLSTEEMGQLYASLDTGKLVGESPQVADLAKWYTTSFETHFKKLKDTWGMDIRARDNYVPYTLIPPANIAAKFRDIAEGAGGFRALGNSILAGEKADLKRGLEFVSGQNIRDAATFEKAFSTATNPQILGEKVGTKAKFLLARKDEIPDWLREKNVADLFTNWISNSYRHVHVRDTVAELKQAARIATTYGDRVSADYIVNLAKDLSGVRRGTFASWGKAKRAEWQTTMLKKAEAAVSATGNKEAGELYRVLGAAPELLTTMNQSMYNSFLGLSPRAALQNMTQPILSTVPELGWAYGSKKLLGAYRDLLHLGAGAEKGLQVKLNDVTAPRFGKKAGDTISASDFRTKLLATGKSTQQFNQEMAREHSSHLQKYGSWRGAEKVFNKWNTASMGLFEGAENINRSTTSLMATSVVRDLLGHTTPKDAASAQAFVRNMGPAYRAEIGKALAEKDLGRVAELVSNYLIGKTMFDYNRLTMSEYGRFMGPMFSVFTKWPTAIAGDIVVEMQRRGLWGGAGEVGRKYMLPLTLLYGVSAALGDGFEESDVGQATAPLRGSQGLVGMTPISTVKSVVTGEMAAPPAVSLVRDLGMGLATADMYKIYRSMNDVATTYLPIIPALARAVVQIDAWTRREPAPKGTLLNQVSQMMGAGEPDKEVKDFSKELHESIFGQ